MAGPTAVQARDMENVLNTSSKWLAQYSQQVSDAQLQKTLNGLSGTLTNASQMIGTLYTQSQQTCPTPPPCPPCPTGPAVGPTGPSGPNFGPTGPSGPTGPHLEPPPPRLPPKPPVKGPGPTPTPAPAATSNTTAWIVGGVLVAATVGGIAYAMSQQKKPAMRARKVRHLRP